MKSFKTVYLSIFLIFVACSRNTYSQLYEQAANCQSRGEYREALAYYIKALDFPTKDYFQIAYNYYNQYQILNDIVFDYKSCVSCLNNAKYYFDKCSNVTMSYICQFELLNLHINYDNLSQAETILSQIDLSKLPDDSGVVNSYFVTYIYFLIKSKSDLSVLRNIISEYLNNIEDVEIPNPILAWGLKLLDPDTDVEKYLNDEDGLICQEDKVRFYNCLYNIQLLAGDYKSAVNTLESLYSNIFSMTSDAIEQELQFADDVVGYEKAKAQSSYLNFVLCFVLLLFISILLFILFVFRKKTKTLSLQLVTQNEYLDKLLNGDLPISLDIKASLQDRFDFTNRIFKAYLTNKKVFSKSLDEVMKVFEDRELFENNNRNVITLLHPGFINKLSECGLTEEEINYCCLYVMGLSGKDITIYLESNSHYNLSSSIRKKLDLGAQDTNLALYLKSILNEKVMMTS